MATLRVLNLPLNSLNSSEIETIFPIIDNFFDAEHAEEILVDTPVGRTVLNFDDGIPLFFWNGFVGRFDGVQSCREGMTYDIKNAEDIKRIMNNRNPYTFSQVRIDLTIPKDKYNLMSVFYFLRDMIYSAFPSKERMDSLSAFDEHLIQARYSADSLVMTFPHWGNSVMNDLYCLPSLIAWIFRDVPRIAFTDSGKRYKFDNFMTNFATSSATASRIIDHYIYFAGVVAGNFWPRVVANDYYNYVNGPVSILGHLRPNNLAEVIHNNFPSSVKSSLASMLSQGNVMSYMENNYRNLCRAIVASIPELR